MRRRVQDSRWEPHNGLSEIREDSIVDDADGGVLAHLDRVEPLVTDRLGVPDGDAHVPGGADARVHAAGRPGQQSLDRVVQLLLVVEARLAAKIEVRVPAGRLSALPEDAPDVPQPLLVRHRRRWWRRRALPAIAGSRKAAAAGFARDHDALRARVVLQVLPE